VAAATLAILLVCFSIYQYSQLDPELQARTPNPRLPRPPTQLAASTLHQASGSSTGAEIGGANIGEGRDVRLSLYRPEGTSPFGEIAFHSWEPVEGVPDELLVVEPEIRLRTKDGHGIRVTASEATLEGNLKGGLNLKRGRLVGDVLIEYDRLTREDRANLPPEQRDKIDPAHIVRIDLEALDFDLEYSKVSVPRGEVKLTARDIDFRASDMEIRFNEDQGRVEHIRITNGGRIELRELSDELGLSLAGTGSKPQQQGTVVEWLREALQETLAAQEASKPVEPQAESDSPAAETADGVPIFRPDAKETDEPARLLRYLAHFEDDVDAKQWIGQVAQSRLQSDSLEILRVISNEDRQRVRSTAQPSTMAGDQLAEPVSPGERVLLEWAGRLVVDAVLHDDPRWAEDVETRITATGSPVMISNPDGNATCTQLTLDADGSKVWLAGTPADPVIVRSAEQGTMTGLEVYTKRSGDTLDVSVAGPGVLSRTGDVIGVEVPGAEASQEQPLTVKFSEQLDVHGRFVTRRSIDFTGRISSQEHRVLDEASFLGRVEMQQGDTSLKADALTLEFGAKRGQRDDRQTIEHVTARGHVVMKQGDDRLAAREIDLVLTADRDGQVVPLTAIALGDVEAVRDDRTIHARDKLIADFEMVSRPTPPFDVVQAHAQAVEAGLDVAEIDWEARRREHEAQKRQEVGIRRLQAFGEVSVVDPAQAFDLTAAELDSTVVRGREIEKASVKGIEGHPATVHMGTFTVTGNDIDLNVPDQWAHVPGAGRLSFRSRRDLDGRKVETPIPISVEWQDWMKYRPSSTARSYWSNLTM
jgi:lipopolysaccharide export system protein LptA